MKRNKIRYVLLSMVALLSLSACEIETHDNDKLDGFWHLERVDTIATGGVCDKSKDLVFWSVQSMFVEVSERSKVNNDKYIFSFSHRDGKLSLFDARLSDRSNGDPEVEDPIILHPYGISKLNETFEVMQLTGSKMQLKSESLLLVFRKF
mgnify:FL=1